MNLLSAPVMGAAALLAGPALWQGLVTGEAPLEHALGRYAVTVAIVWVALSAVVMLVEATGPALSPARSSDPSIDDETVPGRPGGMGGGGGSDPGA